MTTARSQQICVETTPYYHCVSRCVRRSFLCGEDPITQRNYEHRREWIKQKMYALSQVYCIDVCAYAIMSNHYHLVVHINREKALNLSNSDVIARWKQEHKLPTLVIRWQSGQLTSQAEIDACMTIIESWRERLWSLSWFMKELNFDIACQANKEDDCKGHFWESRFKSQALLDEQALAAAMAYVDLNPLRAGIADTPEASDYTSIQARLEALNHQQPTAPCLHSFIGNPSNEARMGIHIPPIFQRLNISQRNWLEACTQLDRRRSTAVGYQESAEQAKLNLNKRRIHLLRLDS